MGFDLDAIQNRAHLVIGCFHSRSITACASKCATRHSRATRVTAPEIIVCVDVTLDGLMILAISSASRA
jgi:hypothetical protein